MKKKLLNHRHFSLNLNVVVAMAKGLKKNKGGKKKLSKKSLQG